MKAMVREGHGGPEVLELRDVDTPVPGDGVLVRVRASSVTMGDVDYLRGRPWVARLATGLRTPKVRIPGIDVSGVVEAVGPGVRGLGPGDEVFADLTSHGSGAWAEYVSVPEVALTRKPLGVSFVAAATVPSSGVFAIQGLERPPVRSGDEVLVKGASGNVGPFAVQIAKAMGATVTAVCSAEKMDMVRELGADRALDYRREDYTRLGSAYDAIVDIAARGSILTLLTDKHMGLIMWRANDRRDMADLAGLLDAGKLVPRIDRTFELAGAAEAVRYLETGRPQGKVVIEVA